MIKKSLILFVFTVLLFSPGCIKKALTEMDHALLVTIDDLKGLDLDFPENAKKYEKFSKTVYLDGTVDIDYEYELPDEVESDIGFIAEGYAFNRTASDQFLNDSINDKLFVSVLEMYDLVLEENKKLSFVKEGMKIYEIKSKEGIRVGNHLVMSTRKMNYTFTLIGVYIDSREVWSKIFASKLKKAGEVQVGLFGLK